MRLTLVSTLVAVLAIVPGAMGQQFVLGSQAGQNTTTGTPAPYGNYYSGQRSQYLYQATELLSAGMTAGNIDFLGFPVVTPGTPDLTPNPGSDGYLDAFEIKIGLTMATDLSAGWDMSPLTTVYGPDNAWQDVPGWNWHTFLAPFPWDGTSNILIEICHWNGQVSYGYNAVVYNSPTTFVSSLTYREDTNPSCGGTQTPTYIQSIRPDTAFGYGMPPLPEFQVNSPAASLDVNGNQGNSIAPASTSVVLNAPLSLNLNSTNIGLGFEIFADAPGPILPTSAGGFGTLGGQVININLASPGAVPLFNFALPPFPGAVSLGFSIPVPLTVSAQMLIIDPALLDGFAVSAGADLAVLNCVFGEDFETGVVGNPGTYPLGWVDGGGTYAWRVNSGGTTSSSTGPAGDHTSGSGLYMYCETSSPVAVGNTFILNAPAISAPAFPVNANFWVNMYGASIGTLNLEEYDGANWNVRWTLSGDQGPSWLNQVVPLLTPTGGQYVLRFHYTAAADPAGTVFYGDAAIDDFRVCQ